MKKLLLCLLAVVLIAMAFAYKNQKDKIEPSTEVQPVVTVAEVETPVIETELKVTPHIILQGEPFMVTIEGIEDMNEVRTATFDKKKINLLKYEGKVVSFVGFDLNKKPGTYELSAELADGKVLNKTVTITQRKRIEAPLGIPEKLGGNTATSTALLIKTLAEEAKIINNIQTADTMFWTQKFRLPLETNFITDTYGYARQTNGIEIAHKGTDFRAKEGTEVFAMNDGEVRIVQDFRNYGKTIAIDHGLGIQTLYLHLSKSHVREGDKVTKGQLIGLSGMTGYAEAPHLHLSIKINGISIDPMKFMEFFK